jgi:hypothetical protein
MIYAEKWHENKWREHGNDKCLKRIEEENMLCRPNCRDEERMMMMMDIARPNFRDEERMMDG